MFLAGDLGGTKTLLGLFRPGRPGRRGHVRPAQVLTREYHTLDFHGLDAIVETFIDEVRRDAILEIDQVQAICIGVAGPVTDLVARLTNVPWLADATPIAARFDDCPVELMNDLEAMAHSVTVLEPSELATLQEGVAVPTGNAALIAAGTGLGEALLHNVEGAFIPSPSEGGHADFAARTPRELAFVEEQLEIGARVENESVISGHGIINLFRFAHGTKSLESACRVVDGRADVSTLPALITRSALEGRCEQCAEAVDMFIEAYGAEAGNLAVRSVATAGVYVGGGIAPKILPALEHGPFLDAFRDKEPMTDMLRNIPVRVILNAQAGLIGAAVRAAAILERRRLSGNR